MTSTATRSSWPKRILLLTAGLVAFSFLFVVALRITVIELYRGIATSRATGLSAISPWDARSMWATAPMLQRSVDSDKDAGPNFLESSVARTAFLLSHSSSFDRSVAQLNRVVAAHQGYLEDLRTESQLGMGRSLAATLSVPSKEFEGTLTDLKTLGRIEASTEAGEDSAVKLASAERHVGAAHTSLSRLQRLQRERKGELRDAVALEKDITQATAVLAEAERQQDFLRSTVAQAHIRFTLIEDYRAPLQANFADASLGLRNSLVEGVSTILSSIALILGVVLEYGLPLLFWAALLFLPARLTWRRLRRAPAPAPAA